MESITREALIITFKKNAVQQFTHIFASFCTTLFCLNPNNKRPYLHRMQLNLQRIILIQCHPRRRHIVVPNQLLLSFVIVQPLISTKSSFTNRRNLKTSEKVLKRQLLETLFPKTKSTSMSTTTGLDKTASSPFSITCSSRRR